MFIPSEFRKLVKEQQIRNQIFEILNHCEIDSKTTRESLVQMIALQFKHRRSISIVFIEDTLDRWMKII